MIMINKKAIQAQPLLLALFHSNTPVEKKI